MQRSVWLAGVLVAMTACAPPRPAVTVTPSPVASSSAAPGAAATQLPVRLVEQSRGTEFARTVQETTDPGSTKSRILYDVRYVSSVGVRTNATNAVATLDRPHIIFYDRTGKTLIADSPKAKITQQDKGVFMSGGVHARAQDGSVLTCDRLHYDGRTSYGATGTSC
jgi:hypothetical protein